MVLARFKNKLHQLQEYAALRHCLATPEQVPVLVYTMGKVGSSSIAQSLSQQFLSQKTHPVFQIHRMNPEHIQAVRSEYLRHHHKPPKDDIGLALYHGVIKQCRPAKIITLVRDPIHRNISAFFQNFGRFTGVNYQQSSLSTEALIEGFLANYNHTIPLTWFDQEIKAVLGFDVYQYPFSQAQGCLQHTHKNFEILILKSEIEDRVKEQAIQNFLGLKAFQLQRYNVAQTKAYSQTYQAFLQTIQLPDSYLEAMYQAPYTQHFYSAAEITKMRQKWGAN